MFGWYLLSIAWSINRVYTFRYLFYIICGISIVLTIIYYARDVEKQKKLFKALSYVFIIEIIICLLEIMGIIRLPVSPFSPYSIYFGREMKNTYLDLDQAIRAQIISSPTGFSWNPNNLATTMVILLPFFLFFKNKFVKYIAFLSLMIIIVMSGSRGNFIASLFGIFLYLFIYSKKRAVKSVLFLILLLPIIIPATMLVIESLKQSENIRISDMVYSYDVLKRYIIKDEESEDSIGVRHQLIRNGLNALKNSYGLGVGGGGSQVVQENIGGVAGHISSMHNFWVEMLVDSGIIFTTIFVSWYIGIILILYKIYVRTDQHYLKYFASSTSLSMICFSVGVISASSVIYLLPMWLMFGFAIATINNYERLSLSKGFTT